MMVLYYTFIQGVGISIAYFLDPRYTVDQVMRAKFFYGEYVDKYIALMLLAVSIAMIATIINTRNVREEKKYQESLQTYISKVFFFLGILLLLFFTVFMVINLVTGNVVIGNYESYKRWANSNVIRNYSQIGYWIASIFICACGTKKQIGISFFIFLIPSVILVVAGNRNDIMFPLLIGLGLYYLRFKKVPKSIIILILVFIFIMFPLIIQLRNGVITQNTGATLIYSSFITRIAETFFELGGQLHAVSNMFEWLNNGESKAYGLTYIYGFMASLFGALIPEIRVFFEGSRYYLSERLPSLGFAMSAEVYFNFGILGVIIVYWLIGMYISKYETRERTEKELIKYGFVMLWLLILVRNSFGYSLVYAKVFVVLYFAGVCYLSTRKGSKST